MPRPSKAVGSVALVTGATRGIGLAFVRELAARGAKKVYAGVRNPDTLADEFAALPAEVVPLDVTAPRVAGEVRPARGPGPGRGGRRRGRLPGREPAGQQRRAVHQHATRADR